MPSQQHPTSFTRAHPEDEAEGVAVAGGARALPAQDLGRHPERVHVGQRALPPALLREQPGQPKVGDLARLGGGVGGFAGELVGVLLILEEITA